jgi:hypothetical protein
VKVKVRMMRTMNPYQLPLKMIERMMKRRKLMSLAELKTARWRLSLRPMT